jgi:putative membrane protein
MISLLIAAASAPALAVSLASTTPAEPIPEYLLAQNVDSFDSPAAGSSTLIPVVAADVQATQASTADAQQKAAGGGGKAVDDITFVKKATESGRKEVASARDALPQLKKPELKRIAEMLVSDHGNANARLARIAENKGWPVPAPAAAAPPPSGTASSDFDAKWTAEMIAGHERSIALYRAQAQDGEDQELRQYARETLPTIEHHLEELRSTQK